MAGLGSGNSLAEHVHPNLSESAALTCKAVDAMGQTVEKVLIKHGEKTCRDLDDLSIFKDFLST